MNKAKIAAAAASLSVLAIGWELGTQLAPAEVATTQSGAPMTPVPTTVATSSGPTKAGTTPPATTTTSRTTTSTTPATSGSYKDGTYAGATQTHRFGSVTVSITVVSGKITDVQADAVANDGHSAQINSRSVPQLRTEVLAAQSASVRTVSGATYTSRAYISSLQAALDQAAA